MDLKKQVLAVFKTRKQRRKQVLILISLCLVVALGTSAFLKMPGTAMTASQTVESDLSDADSSQSAALLEEAEAASSDTPASDAAAEAPVAEEVQTAALQSGADAASESLAVTEGDAAAGGAAAADPAPAESLHETLGDGLVRDGIAAVDETEMQSLAETLGAETQPSETETAVAMPAQEFEGEADGVRVHVTAPEGAFPAGTVMNGASCPTLRSQML